VCIVLLFAAIFVTLHAKKEVMELTAKLKMMTVKILLSAVLISSVKPWEGNT